MQKPSSVLSHPTSERVRALLAERETPAPERRDERLVEQADRLRGHINRMEQHTGGRQLFTRS